MSGPIRPVPTDDLGTALWLLQYMPREWAWLGKCPGTPSAEYECEGCDRIAPLYYYDEGFESVPPMCLQCIARGAYAVLTDK